MPTSNQNNIIVSLPLMRFRGVGAPQYDMISSSGGHQQAQFDYPYVDAAGHDNIRRNPIQCSFRLYFLNSISPDSFPDLFREWTDIFVFDGSLGELIHPYWGGISVRPMNWDIDVNASQTSGCVMTVAFSETLEDPTEFAEVPGAVIAMREAARKADEAIKYSDIKYPTGERTDNLLDMVNQIESFVFSARLTIEGVKNQALGIINGLIEDVESLNSNYEWATKDALLELWASVYDIEKKIGINRARKTHSRQVLYRTTMDKFASEVGNTVGEIMTLNGKLLGRPDIPAFTDVKYYTE